jgi:putative transposase
MRRFELTDEQWDKIKLLLPGKEGDSGRTAKDNRLFIDAVLWIVRTGAQWRDLPARFGNWNSIYQRFNRWAKAGRWQAIFEQIQDPDLEWLLLDSTIIRAHQHAAGALKKGENKPWDDREAVWGPKSTSLVKGSDCRYVSC